VEINGDDNRAAANATMAAGRIKGFNIVSSISGRRNILRPIAKLKTWLDRSFGGPAD